MEKKMASIYSKKGILYLKYYIEGIDGKRKAVQYSLRLNDTRENRKIAKLIQREKELELMKPSNSVIKFNLTLDNSFKLFLIRKKNAAEKTKYNYKKMYEHLNSVINKNILVKNITKSDIEDYENYLRSELKLSVNTVASYFKDLNTFWNWMLSEKIVAEKIVWRIKQEVKTIKVIPEKDFAIILQYLKSKSIDQYRYIKFLKLTGFRVGEALTLKWEDIDFRLNRIILKNHKAKRDDEFPLYYKLKLFLKKFKEDNGKVFKYQNSDSLKFWWRAMKKLKMNYTLHSIRKTFATNLVNNNVSVFDAMKLLRHKSVSTTMKYYTYADLNRLGDEAEKVFGNENLDESESNANEIKIFKM